MTPREIHTLYRDGTTIEILAELNDCTKHDIRECLKYAKSKPRKKEYPIGMILHDWNADKPLETIAHTYGFKDTRTLSCWISARRKDGAAFKVRCRR